MRSYRDDDEHFDGQLGSEASPLHFLAALWQVMDECWRVLRGDGSCWINLGDKMAGSRPDGSSGNGLDGSTLKHDGRERPVPDTPRQRVLGSQRQRQSSTAGLRPKSRMLLPHLFAAGCEYPWLRRAVEQEAGLPPTVGAPQWIVRMDVVQSKLNGLPESTTDRVRASHESWFHMVKQERYFAALDEIREGYAPVAGGRGVNGEKASTVVGPFDSRTVRNDGLLMHPPENPLGKLPGSVWEWANEPLILPPDLPQHFAAFASYPIRRIVLGWSPSGICTVCGQPRRPECEKQFQPLRPPQSNARRRSSLGDDDVRGDDNHYGGPVRVPGEQRVSITGYVCACPTPTAPTRPPVVLDPFSGTGTAPIVAAALGRHGIGVDLSWDYHRIARWRDTDGGLRAKALQVDRPEKQLDGQLSLLDGAHVP